MGSYAKFKGGVCPSLPLCCMTGLKEKWDYLNSLENLVQGIVQMSSHGSMCVKLEWVAQPLKK